jgi:membrane associated rhomboid family serine protease
MKGLKFKTSILIASIFAGIFYGAMAFINKVYPVIKPGPILGHTYDIWAAWTPMILGMIVIFLVGFLVYKTDWKKMK